MTEEAKEARRQYYAEYRRKNREKIKAAAARWRADNPDKVKAYVDKYWNKKAAV